MLFLLTHELALFLSPPSKNALKFLEVHASFQRCKQTDEVTGIYCARPKVHTKKAANVKVHANRILAHYMCHTFKALGDTGHMPKRLIIVDGLDECINLDQESRIQKRYAEDQERVQARVLDLIHTLCNPPAFD